MSATLVLTNGRIYTQNPRQPFATAVALRRNKIYVVGSDELRSLVSTDNHHIDLQGATVVPGLVDAHVHFHWFALSLQTVDVYEVPSLEEALQRVKAKAESAPAGRWLEGRGWKHELWEGRAFPTAAHLDRVAPDNPVVLRDKSGHAAWTNSLALKQAGITAETPDPEGGEIQRDAQGNPTGILFETAIQLVTAQVPEPTPAQVVDAMRTAQEKCWQVGLTGIHDFDGPDCFRALQTLHTNRELGLRFYKNIPAALVDHAIALGLRTDFGDEWLRIGGIKIFADGALGPRTALMVGPYEGEPHNRGIVVTDKEEMMAIAGRASANGLSVTVHAIGDLAVHDVLDVYEAVRQQERERHKLAYAPRSPEETVRMQPPLRHRIEHVQVYHPDDRDRLAQLNVIASMQPKHATSDMEMADRYWGERARYSYAWRDMQASGALVVFGSDCPVEPIDPLLGIYAAVTRRRPDGAYAPDGWYAEQTFTMEETIQAFTHAAAVTSGQNDRLGSIVAGKLADMTIFDRDIFRVRPEELLETQVIGTLVDGQFKYHSF